MTLFGQRMWSVSVVGCALLVGAAAGCDSGGSGSGSDASGQADSQASTDTGDAQADVGAPNTSSTDTSSTDTITEDGAGQTGGTKDSTESTSDASEVAGGEGDAEVTANGGPADPDGATAADGIEDADDPVDIGPLADWCEVETDELSFFVTSMAALWTLSGDSLSDMRGGPGGNLGGLAGADKICQQIGAATGHGDRTWRAFLSATDDGNGNVVHAIERIGTGPWHDANGRLVSNDLAGLLSERPAGEEASVEDLPDECGLPISLLGDAHDVLTGSNKQGQLQSTDPESTCMNWTSSDGSIGSSGGGGGPGPVNPKAVLCGHSFPREGDGGPGPGGKNAGKNWMSDHAIRGCGKGANLIQNGPGTGTCVGCSGGYGAVYCFAAD